MEPTAVTEEITARDREMARICIECPVCSRAREKQRGIAYTIVRLVEGRLCPCCRAYERVYGRKAHAPAGSSTGGAT